MDEDERCSDEEAAYQYRQYLFERDFIQNNKRIQDAWDDLVSECDAKRKERKEQLWQR